MYICRRKIDLSYHQKVLIMKKIITSIAIVVLSFVSISCNKQNHLSISNPSECQTCDEFDYDSYIEQLAKETGIDIVSISCYPIVGEIAKYDKKIIKRHTQEKGVMTDSKYRKICNLVERMQIADANNQTDSVLIIYDSLRDRCATIDGFVFNMDQYGVQEVVFDVNQSPVYLPINDMHAQEANMIELFEEISASNDNFNNLSDSQKEEVVAAALYVKLNDSKLTNPSDCIERAGKVLTAEITLYTVAYTSRAASCAIYCFAGPAIAACEALQFGIYIGQCAVAIHRYNETVANC